MTPGDHNSDSIVAFVYCLSSVNVDSHAMSCTFPLIRGGSVKTD